MAGSSRTARTQTNLSKISRPDTSISSNPREKERVFVTKNTRTTPAAILLVISVLGVAFFIGCGDRTKPASKTIRVGVLAPFNTQPGEGIRNGIAMAVEEINAAGGV